MSSFSFDLLRTDRTDSAGQARAGLLHTPHGDIPTPIFMPVGTQATVKTVSPQELEDLGAKIILSNTYHLFLRPGADLVAELGGLHRFMGWNHPILTDSGGFQVFSLGHLRRLDDDGAIFKSHIDGALHRFTPERATEAQEQLGADIIMAFDECAPPQVDEESARIAMERTHRWASRCQSAHMRSDQALFGIVQGGMYPALRRESARTLAAMDFPGYGIGGLAVGEAKPLTWAMLETVTEILPDGKPRYLMGVGAPEDLLDGVARGVDMFDCVLPTRIARNGALFTRSGRLNIRNTSCTRDARPIEDGCTCYTCRHFSRAYLRHLFKAEEILGLRLMTIHNLHFLLDLMRRVRQSILDGEFLAFRQEFMQGYQITDSLVQAQNKARWLARARLSPKHLDISKPGRESKTKPAGQEDTAL
jgi:queuine tRNA-ribosyltransferase